MPHLLRTSSALAVCILAGAWIRVRADAPPARYVIDSDTVKDTRTGLVWQRKVGMRDGTFDAAGRYCQTLTLAGGGWRLPGVKELATLVDPTRNDPAIDPTAFPGTPSVFFWSASAPTSLVGVQARFGVNFRTGAIHPVYSSNLDAPAATTNAVRCVR